MTTQITDQETGANDPLYADACALVIEKNLPSVSMVQRRLCISYQRAQRMLEAMEGTVISPFSARGVRRVINKETVLIAALEAQVEAITKERDALLKSSIRLADAAFARDTTMGDPCGLMAAQAELRDATKQALDAISATTRSPL